MYVHTRLRLMVDSEIKIQLQVLLTKKFTCFIFVYRYLHTRDTIRCIFVMIGRSRSHTGYRDVVA